MRPPTSSHCLYRYQKWQGRGWGEQVWTPKPLFPACLPAAFGEKRAIVKGICERTPNFEPSRWNIVTILRNCLVKIVVSSKASEQARGRVKRRNDAPQKVSFPDLFIRMQPPSHGDGILTVMILQNYWVDIVINRWRGGDGDLWRSLRFEIVW